LTWLLLAYLGLATVTHLGCFADQPPAEELTENGAPVSGHTMSARSKRAITESVTVGSPVWRGFIFFGPSQPADRQFTFSGSALVDVTDAFCFGDRFQVFDNDVLLGTTSAAAAPSCIGGSLTGYSAWLNNKYSRGTFAVGAGDHTIKIVPIASTFGAGGAYLRARSSPVCRADSSNYGIPQTPNGATFAQAAQECQNIGMQFADITINLWNEATSLAFNCSGANTQTWMKSWQGDSYGGECIALYTGSGRPGGSINVMPNCSDHRLVLCKSAQEVRQDIRDL